MATFAGDSLGTQKTEPFIDAAAPIEQRAEEQKVGELTDLPSSVPTADAPTTTSDAPVEGVKKDETGATPEKKKGGIGKLLGRLIHSVKK